MKSKGLEKIFERKGALCNCSFVVSSRPCEAAYQLIPVCEQHFHLAGLNDQRLEELLVRRLGEAVGQAVASELKQAKWSQLRALMKETPLIANMVAALRLDEQPLPSTRTELYTMMVVNMVRRATAKSSKHKGCMVADTLNDLPAEKKTALSNIGRVAMNGLKQQRYVFNLEKEVRPVCGDAAHCLGFVEEFQIVSVRGQRHEVQFSHLTFQEYLAAYFVAHSANLESELESCRRTIGFGEETVPFWRFVGGMLGREKVKVLMSFLSRSETDRERRSSGEHLLFQMSCFAEAMEQPYTEDTTGTGEEQSTSSVQEATKAFLPAAVDLSCQLLSVSDFHAVGVSLFHSSHVAELNLSATGLNTDRVETLCAAGGLQHVHHLLARNNAHLHGDGLATLANVLGKNGKLLEVRFSACGLDINDCDALKHILTTNKNLNTLSLYGNTLSADAFRSLQPTLASSQLRCLHLERTSMDAEGARLVGEVVIANPNLEQLFLDDNPLGNHGATLLLESTKTAKALEHLSMDHVDADDGVLPFLLATIQEKATGLGTGDLQRDQPATPLTTSLHRNNISIAALEHLATQLPRSSTDQIICGMHVIQNGEMHRKRLSKYFANYSRRGGKGDLNMNSMGINHDGVAQITAAHLKHDRSAVEALQLGHNSVQDKSAALLAHALGSNSTLRPGPGPTFQHHWMPGIFCDHQRLGSVEHFIAVAGPGQEPYLRRK